MMKCKKVANSLSVFALLHQRRLSKAAAFPEYVLPKVTAPLSQPAVHYLLHHDFFGKFFNCEKSRVSLLNRSPQNTCHAAATLYIHQGRRPAVS